jgi:hypothetical protein
LNASVMPRIGSRGAMSMAAKRLAEAVEVIVINWIVGGFAAVDRQRRCCTCSVAAP